MNLIGRYQFENLIKNKIGFTFLDLGVADRDHEWIKNSVPIAPEAVLEYIENAKLQAHAPIVLICENGSNSLSVADRLGDKSYINVFVIEGGRRALLAELFPA